MTVHVDSVTNIGKVLAQLRRTRTVAAEGEIGSSARVATMNFIVFVDDADHRPWVLERAQRIVDKHPSRLIVLDSTTASGGVDVSTTARQTSAGTVVNERVDVSVGDIDHAAIRSITQELTAPDVPTALWWSGARLLQSRTFQGLAELASDVLVDSSGKSRDEETIRELGEFLSRFPGVALRDLAFMRLLPWQDMIAQFFDDPALRDDLFSLTSLRIESGSDAEALYLGGWLASRLSWEVDGRNAFRTRDGRHIPFECIAGGDQRRVISVRLTSTDSTYLAAISDSDAGVACLSVSGAKAKTPWCVPLQSIDNTSLIERAILQSGTDQVFETSLLTVRDLLG